MAGTDLGLQGFGYGANAGDPMGFWQQGNRERQALKLKNDMANYEFQAQKQADDALPAILMGLGHGQQMGMPQQDPTAMMMGPQSPQPPMPGQASVPSQPSMPGPPPMPPPMPPPQQSFPPGAMGAQPDATGFAGLQRMPAASLDMPGGPPPQQGAGPNIQRMGDMQQPQQQAQQSSGVPGMQAGYDLPTVMEIIKKQYPGVSGGALRNLLTTINPLIFTPAARMQVEMLKAYTSRANTGDRVTGMLEATDRRNETSMRNTDVRSDTSKRNTDVRYGTGSLDGEKLGAVVNMFKQFGKAGIAGLPPGVQMQAMEQAQKEGFMPEDIAGNMAENAGQRSEANAVGTRTGAIRVAAEAVNGAADMALASSNAIDRTRYPNINAIQQAIQRGTGDEKITDFIVKNNTLINEYAAAQNPRGVPRIEDKKHAREMLDKAYTKGQYATAVKAIQQEVANIKHATKTVRGQSSGSQKSQDNNSDPGFQPGPPDVGTVEQGYRFKGGDPSVQTNWEPVGGM